MRIFRLVILAVFLAGARVAGAAPAADADPEFRKAVALLDRKDYAAARAILQGLTRAHRDEGLYWFNLGGASFNLGDYTAAQAAFEQVVHLRGPLAPAALLCVAKCQRKLGRPREALRLAGALRGRAEVASLVTGELRTLHDEAMQRGMRAYEAGDYQRALPEFELAAQAQPDDAPMLMKGLTLLRLHRATEARDSLQPVAGASASTAYRDYARFFVDKIGGTSPFWAFLDLGGGENSNVFLDGLTATSESRPLLQVVAGAGAQASLLRPVFLRLGYSGYLEEYPGLSAARFLSQSVRAQIAYESGPWSARLSPAFTHQIYGTSPFATRLGATAYLQRRWDCFTVGGQAEYAAQTGQSTTYSYLTGPITSFRGWLGYGDSEFDFSFAYVLLNESLGNQVLSTGTVPLGDFSQGPSAVLYWYPSEDWEVDATLTYLFRGYGATRSDRQFSGFFKTSVAVSDDLRLFASAAVITNGSTLSTTIVDKNYTQLMGILGVSWQILE